MSDVPEVQISAAMDYTAAYKVKFSLIYYFCCLPFYSLEIHHLSKNAHVGDQTRTWTCHRWCIHTRSYSSFEVLSCVNYFDIQIMPSSNKAKAVFDSGKTTSFHIKSVVACQQSAKSSSIFKLVVQHDNRNKRYDFEAESPKLAGMCFFTRVITSCLIDESR